MDHLDIQNKAYKPKAIHRFEAVSHDKHAAFAGKTYHFIGAGGIGMSGLAKVLLHNQAVVSGSDQIDSTIIEKLRTAGGQMAIGHNAANLPEDVEAVVISAAVKDDNVELRQAMNRDLKIYKYAEMLGELMNAYYGIAIAGTHGKSTTSGWLTFCLKQLELDPNFVIGADLKDMSGSSGVGTGEYFIAEACEYDRSFLNLRPRLACILNIEPDHLDYYRNLDEIIRAFSDFVAGLKHEGTLIVNGDDPNAIRAVEILRDDIRLLTFGLDRSCNLYADNLTLQNSGYDFDVFFNRKKIGHLALSMPGRHNIYNALAVVAIASQLHEVRLEPLFEVIGQFTGVDRRLMLKAEMQGITVIDDYAHHPTEIRASLAALQQRYQPERLWCVFQPHQYSRTRFLLDDFAESFKLADVTIMPEIYFVRDSEATKKQVNANMLVERIRQNGQEALFVETFGQIVDFLLENVKTNDVVVVMGAGDIWKVADEYIQRFRQNC